MTQCDVCGSSLDDGRGNCPRCGPPCPRCRRPNGHPASPGYCAACWRERRRTVKQSAPHRGQKTRLEPGLRPGQSWFQNRTAANRLPVQHITLDVERTVEVLMTFYTPDEFRALVQKCLQHTETGTGDGDERRAKDTAEREQR